MGTLDTKRAHLTLATAGKTLSVLLQEAMNRKDMSQAELARLSNVTRPAVNQALTGRRIPSEQVTKKWDAVLGTGDDLTTQAALDRAARGRSSSGPGRPHVSTPRQLPAATVRLVGRHREAIRLGTDLVTPEMQVVTIAGGVGAGSTSLACTVAAQVKHDYRGELYTRGHGHTPGRGPATVKDILAKWLTALGVRAIPSNISDQIELYRRLLRNLRLLLMIDDATNEQVQALMPGDSPSTLLVTTRHRLSSLAVSGNAAIHALTPLPDEHAKEMLASHIETSQSISEDVASVNRVLDVCAGLPRAIAAAAELINTRGLRRAVDLLQAEPFDALDAIHDDPTSSLAKAYHACWTCLTTPAQDMLTRLATREPQYWTTAAHDATADAARDELVREHLVSVEGGLSPLLRAWVRFHTRKQDTPTTITQPNYDHCKIRGAHHCADREQERCVAAREP